MAVAEIIGAAVGVLLLIIVAYIVVGSTLTTAETVSFAQKDLTLQQRSAIENLHRPQQNRGQPVRAGTEFQRGK